MPYIKINQPTQDWLGTTIEIDGRPIHRVRSIDYHVCVDEEPEISLEMSGTGEIDLDAEYIKLDISPLNAQDAFMILRHELSKENPRHKHFGTDNELRNGFIASIKSALEEGFSMPDGITDDELAEKILDRLIGEE